jgi:hypothetical protein
MTGEPWCHDPQELRDSGPNPENADQAAARKLLPAVPEPRKRVHKTVARKRRMFARILNSLARRWGKRYFIEGSPTHSLPFTLERLPRGRMASFGSRNPGRVFYVIWRERFGSGFFSNLSHVLCHLMIADTLRMEPIVDFENFPTLYNEDDEVQGTRNAWEYYFRQPSSVPLREVYESRHVFLCDGKYPDGFSMSVTTIPGSVEVFSKTNSGLATDWGQR